MDGNAIKLIKAIDKSVETAEQRKKGRTHLGASVLGRKCAREVWYNWRWAHVTQHTGRLLRLFERGRDEEQRFTGYLRALGLEVREYGQRLIYYSGQENTHRYIALPWDAPIPEYYEDVSANASHVAIAEGEFGVKLKQQAFSDHNGHFGGSGDGELHGLQALFSFNLEGPGLLEAKTHGEKSFVDLAGKLPEWRAYQTDPKTRAFTGKGLLTSKLEHYIQMQVYMHYFGLKWGLYLAVCKNTDDLYFEIIHYKPEIGMAYADRAQAIIDAKSPPARITDNPSWWECKFCDYREICHYGKQAQKSCRSCAFAVPVENAEWRCTNYQQLIPKDFIPQGCDAWVSITS